MSLIGDLGDPVKDAAAFKPVVDSAVDRIIEGLKQILETHKITITFEKKDPTS